MVVDAFDSLCRRVRHGGFPRLDGREDLWQVLVMLVQRKAINQKRRELAAKRGGRLQPLDPTQLDQLSHKEPTAEFAAELVEQISQLRETLGDRAFHIVVAKMEGFKNGEIAKRVGTSVSTVERTLSLVRKRWESET